MTGCCACSAHAPWSQYCPSGSVHHRPTAHTETYGVSSRGCRIVGFGVGTDEVPRPAACSLPRNRSFHRDPSHGSGCWAVSSHLPYHALARTWSGSRPLAGPHGLAHHRYWRWGHPTLPIPCHGIGLSPTGLSLTGPPACHAHRHKAGPPTRLGLYRTAPIAGCTLWYAPML